MRKLLIPLFAALLAVGAYIRIPVPPVPITLQTLFVAIMALTLNWKENLVTCVVWIFLGAIGLPIFTSGGGIAALTGPTAGYIWTIPVSAVIASLIRGKKDSRILDIILVILVNLIIYIGGTAYLAMSRHLSAMDAIAAGVLPFLVGDVIKMAIAVIISPRLRKEVKRLSDDND